MKYPTARTTRHLRPVDAPPAAPDSWTDQADNLADDRGQDLDTGDIAAAGDPGTVVTLHPRPAPVSDQVNDEPDPSIDTGNNSPANPAGPTNPAGPANPAGPVESAVGVAVRVDDRLVPTWVNRWLFHTLAARLRRGVHRQVYRVLRVPEMLVMLAGYWPDGVKVVARRWWDEATDARGKAERATIAQERDLLAARDQRPHWAIQVARFVIVLAVAPWIVLQLAVSLTPFGWIGLALLAIVVGLPALGYLGRPDPDAPLLPRPSDEGKQDERPMDQPTLTECLADLDIPKLTRAIDRDGPKALRWVKVPVEVRDLEGRVVGWTADIGLPGVTVKKVGAKLELLAGNLGRDETDVFVDRLTGGTATEMTIFVARKRTTGVRVWGPAEGGGNVYRPRRVGTTPRGDEVRLGLWNDEGTENVLVTGVMGSGKSATNRCLAANHIEDPYAEVAVIDFKASADFLDLEPLSRPGNFLVDGDPEGQLPKAQRIVDRLRHDVVNRNAILRQLNNDPNKPSSKKATETLAQMRIGLHPILLIVEELPRVAHIKGGEPGRHQGKEFVRSLLDLVSVARSVGIAVVISMQRASAKLFDTDLRALLQLGICHACDDESNRMTLGDAVVSAGYSTASWTKADRGKAIIGGLPGGPVTCQFDFVPDDPDMLADIVARSLELRRQLRLFPAEAGGPAAEPPDETVAVVYDVYTAVDGEARIWSSVVAERLAVAEPGRYAGWTGREVTNALNAAAEHLGVEFPKGLSRNVRIEGSSAPSRGYVIGDLMRLHKAADKARIGVTGGRYQ